MSHGHHGGGGFGGGHHHHHSGSNFGGGHHHHHHHEHMPPPMEFGFRPRRSFFWGSPWGFGRPYGFYRPRYYHYRRSGCGVLGLAFIVLFALVLIHLWWLIIPLAFLAIFGIAFMTQANRHRVPNMHQPYPGQGYPYNQQYQQYPNQNNPYYNQPPYQSQPNNPYDPNQGYPY